MRRTGYFLLLGSLAVATAGFSTGAQAYSEQLPDPMDFGVVYEKIAFEAADTDGNDLVSEGEFVRDAAAAFAGLDFDRDGKLSPKELGAHDAKRFAAIDANGDGFLTFTEVMTYKMKAFRAADANKDNALSFDEMVASATADVAKE